MRVRAAHRADDRDSRDPCMKPCAIARSHGSCLCRRLTALGFSCEAPPPPTQACGPWRPQAPSTKSRPDVRVLQDDPRGASTDASPSWAMRQPSRRDACQHHEDDRHAIAAVAARRGPAFNAACGPSRGGPQQRVASAAEAGPSLEATAGILFPGQSPQRFRRGLDVCRARRRATQTQTSNARPLADLTPTPRRFASTPRAQPGQQSFVHRAQFEATRRVLLACTNARSTRRRHPGRASLEARPAPWHWPSALRDAPIADDDFAAVAQRTQASAARPAPPRRKPAGPGARRRPRPMVALRSPAARRFLRGLDSCKP